MLAEQKLRLSGSAYLASTSMLMIALLPGTEKKKIPASIGKSVVPFSVLLLMALAIIAGFALGATMVLVSVIVYMVRYIQLNNTASNTSDEATSSCGPEYRNGRDGYGYYYGADDSIFSSAGSNVEEEDKA